MRSERQYVEEYDKWVKDFNLEKNYGDVDHADNNSDDKCKCFIPSLELQTKRRYQPGLRKEILLPE